MKFTGLLAFLGIAAVASAASVTTTFSFNTLTGGGTQSLAVGSTSAQIQAYMDAVLTAAGCTGCSVIVTGGVADHTYSGEGHAVGPNGVSQTLGTTDGATSNSSSSPSKMTGVSTDNFLANTNDSSTNISSQITIQFKGFTGLTLTGFDYEIFPDGTCTALYGTFNSPRNNTCGGSTNSNLADFELEAGTNTSGTDPVVNSFGTKGFVYGVAPSKKTDGTATSSPNGSSVNNANPETAPQYIGTWAGSVTGFTELDFVDWPATIGVDNLAISWTSVSSVPDPASLLTLGTVLAMFAAVGWLRKNRAASVSSR